MEHHVTDRLTALRITSTISGGSRQRRERRALPPQKKKKKKKKKEREREREREREERERREREREREKKHVDQVHDELKRDPYEDADVEVDGRFHIGHGRVDR